jgi:N-acetylglucosamine-6-phosphate deacetylase
MADLDIAGGKVLADGEWRPADVIIRAGRTVAIAAPPSRRDGVVEVLDASGRLVAPGYIDVQCNGAVGIDLSREPERVWELAAALPRWGVTAWLPTIVSGPSDVRTRAIAALAAGPPADSAPLARPLGLHFEGPFIAPERAGAHPGEHIVAPDVAIVEGEGWSPERGVAMVTMAPELPGADRLLAALVDRAVVVSAGHSSASEVEATAAIDAGVRSVTHLFNAMAPFHHRQPALAGVALTDDRVYVGMIVDGLHTDPLVVRMAARALGHRLVLVSDAVAALGDRRGAMSLGASEAVADGDSVRLADGTLAGSVLALDQAVRNLVAFAGVPLATAVDAATAAPAALLGSETIGTLAPGATGDAVVLDHDGGLVATVIGGEVAHGEPPWRS